MEELSKYHRLLSGLFKMPQSPEEWEPYRLTQDQVDFFHEEGYLSGFRILDEVQIVTLKEELDRLMDPANPPSTSDSPIVGFRLTSLEI